MTFALKALIVSIGFDLPPGFVAVPIPHPFDSGIPAAVVVAEGRPIGVDIRVPALRCGLWFPLDFQPSL